MTDTATAEPAGTVTGGLRIMLRLEGLALFLGMTLLYWVWDGSWWVYAALFLAPDLSFAAYLFGARFGAMLYNAAHTYMVPMLLMTVGFATAEPLVLSIAMIWLAHIGFDRALGYGLKYSTGFGFTHLGRIGKRQSEQSHRHFAFLVRPSPDRGGLAVTCDHAHAFVDPRGDVIRRAALQERDAIVAAGGQDAVARRLHFRRERFARNGAVAERQAEVARADLGKSKTRYGKNLLAIGDAFGAFQFHPKQQLAFRVKRPGIAAVHVFLGGEAPDGRRR